MNRSCSRPCPDRRRPVFVAWMLVALCFAAFTAETLADYKTAISLFKRQKYRDALKELQPDVSRNPDWEFGHRLAGLCYFYLKEYDNAIRAFERAAELKSTEPSVYLGLAESYYQTGKLDQALAALEKGKAGYTKKADHYNYDRIRAFVLYKQKKFADAAGAIVSAFEHQAGTSQDWLVLGISYYMTGQDTQARQALSTALQMDRSLTSAQVYLDRLAVREAENALKSKNYAQARDGFQAILQQRPDDNALRFNLALAEIGLKNWAGAEALLRPMEPAYAGSFRYYYFHAYVLENLGKNEEAEKSYRKALQLNNDAQAKEGLQRVLRRMGKK